MSDAQTVLPQVTKVLQGTAVELEEAAIDSPSFRATAVHFSDQVEILEKWLDAYVRSIAKLTSDVWGLEDTFNTFLLRSIPPANVSEAVLDHDYTLLAMKRFGEGSKEWWSQIIGGTKKIDANICEPIKAFMATELRNFKDARRYLEQSQKTFDNTLARYVSQSKTKEPSSLREDAFQVHETRKAYLKASLDFCLLAPQLRCTIDRLLVGISTDQWREMKKGRESAAGSFAKWSTEMDRIRGWSKELMVGESNARRDLLSSRRSIGDSASEYSKPSRELEDYNVSTVAFLGSKGPSAINIQSQGKERERSLKQGWLFLRTISGKPARTVWVRRWFYVKNGIFGWLVQGAVSGGVEESEKIGVLLCNVRPAVQEDRRFCFEVKTKNQTILLQAETQGELMEWLETFEVAKNKALEANAKDDSSYPGGIDPAFAITPASVPEFAAKNMDGHVSYGSDDTPGHIDRAGTLPIPGELGGFVNRASFDVASPRRSVTTREEGESGRDHAARIMQKLDLHRKSTSMQSEGPPTASQSSAGGIASLISASHNILPIHAPSTVAQSGGNALPYPQIVLQSPTQDSTPSTLAPATLANSPMPTNLSKSAVIVSGERGIGIGRSDATGGMPSGIMANVWGTTNWGYINRVWQGQTPSSGIRSTPASPRLKPLEPSPKIGTDENLKPVLEPAKTPINASTDSLTPVSSSASHRKAVSVDVEASRSTIQLASKPEVFPSNYPLELKTQEAQFRILFPNVPREDKLILVFRASWNPNDTQQFPGRVYVTRNDVYFYSHHLGIVLITGVSISSISEVTAAPGKDCDYLFLHLVETTPNMGSRIGIKVFLEPLRLLHSRLNFLIDINQAEEKMSLEDIITALVNFEHEDPPRSPSMESWEDVSPNTPADDGTPSGRIHKDRELRATLHIERGLHPNKKGKEVTKYHLPSQPVVYEPPDMQIKSVEREFDISPKALFHLMFGDKSSVFPALYRERRAQNITRGPWIHLDGDIMRRDFTFQVQNTDVLRRPNQETVTDHQIIETMNHHVCYVVTDFKTPWHLPHAKDFMLVSKIVITHVAKSKCKLAIYTKVDWSKTPTFSTRLIEKEALKDCGVDAEDLADIITREVNILGPHSRTKKAVHIYGHVAQQTTTTLYPAMESINPKRRQIKQRGLTKMWIDTVGSFGESMASSVMMWTFAAIQALLKIASAHRFILAALILSVSFNSFYVYYSTSAWWTQRSAATFMARMGVKPNQYMSRAIYLKDLDEAVNSLSPSVSNGHESKCYTEFMDLVNVTDLDSPYEMAGVPFAKTSTRATAKRLRRTRQDLGSYRHDLVIAMRVVNSIERETLKAEWENWLLDENLRCKQAQMMLRENPTNTPATSKIKGERSQEVLGGKEKDVEDSIAGLRKWHQEYCGSCKIEQEMLKQGRQNLTFG